jgi:hypothetical protein
MGSPLNGPNEAVAEVEKKEVVEIISDMTDSLGRGKKGDRRNHLEHGRFTRNDVQEEVSEAGRRGKHRVFKCCHVGLGKVEECV